MGDLVIAPSDPSVMYLGTGEGNPRNSASIGDGVHKSLDGGRTWRASLFPAYGADAVRFGLLAMSSSQDVRFNEERVKQGQSPGVAT